MYNEDEEKAIIEDLEEQITELKSHLSEIRKKGIDTHIIDTQLLNIKPKIRMFEATRDDDDLEKVKNLLDNVRSEIAECEGGHIFDNTLKLIEKVSRELAKEDYKKAEEEYKRLHDSYRKLPDYLRKLIHPTCIHLYERIDEKG